MTVKKEITVTVDAMKIIQITIPATKSFHLQ